MRDSTKQILTAVAASAAGAIAAAVITHYLTKQSIATGKTPLPPGSTPKAEGDTPILAPPVERPGQVATMPPAGQAVSFQQLTQCPPGYHDELGKCVPNL